MKRVLASAALVAYALAAGAAQAQSPLGRLFFTPQERARIAAARAGDGAAVGVEAEPAALVVSGVARNSRKGLVAWIDGHAVPDGGTYAGYRVRVAGGGVSLHRDGEPVRWLPVGRPLAPSAPAARIAARAPGREAP